MGSSTTWNDMTLEELLDQAGAIDEYSWDGWDAVQLQTALRTRLRELEVRGEVCMPGATLLAILEGMAQLIYELGEAQSRIERLEDDEAEAARRAAELADAPQRAHRALVEVLDPDPNEPGSREWDLVLELGAQAAS